MFKLLKTLFFGKEREVPEGYVLQKNVMGRQIAKSDCGTICWIPSRRTPNGMKIPTFLKIFFILRYSIILIIKFPYFFSICQTNFLQYKINQYKLWNLYWSNRTILLLFYYFLLLLKHLLV